MVLAGGAVRAVVGRSAPEGARLAELEAYDGALCALRERLRAGGPRSLSRPCPSTTDAGKALAVRRGGRFFKKRALVALLAALLGVAFVAALGVGRYPVPFVDALRIAVRGTLGLPLDAWSGVACNTVLNTRLPRVLAAMLIGAALAVSGASYQGIFKNPMVSPDLLGVSGEACVGAAAAIGRGGQRPDLPEPRRRHGVGHRQRVRAQHALHRQDAVTSPGKARCSACPST